MSVKLKAWVLYAVTLVIASSLAGCAYARIATVQPVVMKKYSITPSVIRIKQGEPVQLEVTTADVQHSFNVHGLNIDESVQPGKTTRILIRGDKKGEFTIECGIVCGPGHDDMRGKIIVE